MIGAAIIVPTPPKIPFPKFFKPEESPANASFGLRVDNIESYLSPINEIFSNYFSISFY